MQNLPKQQIMNLKNLIKVMPTSIEYHTVKVQAVKSVHLELSQPVIGWIVHGWLLSREPVKGSADLFNEMYIPGINEHSADAIRLMIKGLSLRIDHCAKEYEHGLMTFNSETFMAMREVRLELRELLLMQK
jgi:hypothetical protein